ncbi:LOB domain-containing protein 30-like [Aristolochia californica]|uniref:LOB domain-containing protein 30-like n=1 Tax=Aristolochia californica TaxID=171875 RepID=UPI0035DB0EDD
MIRSKNGRGGVCGPCGACKFLRRKCVIGCIFAPYFDAEQGAGRFAAVHKVFGASNVFKLLVQIPDHKRLDAIVTICYEAQARLRDPVYGIVSYILALQQQVVNLQNELAVVQTHLSSMDLPAPPCYLANSYIPSTLVPIDDHLALVPISRQLQTLPETVSAVNLSYQCSADIELQLLAQEYLSRYFNEGQFQPLLPKSSSRFL